LKIKRNKSIAFFVVILFWVFLIAANESNFGASTNLGMEQKYSYKEMNKDIRHLIRAYPQKVRKEVIGKSVLRRDIPSVILGNPQAPIKIAIVGSIHGREYIGTQLIMKQIEYYLENSHEAYKGEAIEDHLERVCLYFIPMLNPDGVMLSQEGLASVKDKKIKKKLVELNKGCSDFTRWKSNINGIDLNRNFDAKWAEIPIESPGPQGCKGPFPASEPETDSIIKYINKNQFSALLTYHSSGRIIYWYTDQEGKTYERDYRLAEILADYTGYQLVKENSPLGGLKDWFIECFKNPGFTIELGDGKSPLPISQLGDIWEENKYIPLLIGREVYNFY